MSTYSFGAVVSGPNGLVCSSKSKVYVKGNTYSPYQVEAVGSAKADVVRETRNNNGFQSIGYFTCEGPFDFAFIGSAETFNEYLVFGFENVGSYLLRYSISEPESALIFMSMQDGDSSAIISREDGIVTVLSTRQNMQIVVYAPVSGSATGYGISVHNEAGELTYRTGADILRIVNSSNLVSFWSTGAFFNSRPTSSFKVTRQRNKWGGGIPYSVQAREFFAKEFNHKIWYIYRSCVRYSATGGLSFIFILHKSGFYFVSSGTEFLLFSYPIAITCGFLIFISGESSNDTGDMTNAIVGAYSADDEFPYLSDSTSNFNTTVLCALPQ